MFPRQGGALRPPPEVFAPRDFERQNDRYIEIARVAGVELARRALERAELRPADIDGAAGALEVIPPVAPAGENYYEKGKKH